MKNLYNLFIFYFYFQRLTKFFFKYTQETFELLFELSRFPIEEFNTKNRFNLNLRLESKLAVLLGCHKSAYIYIFICIIQINILPMCYIQT